MTVLRSNDAGLHGQDRPGWRRSARSAPITPTTALRCASAITCPTSPWTWTPAPPTSHGQTRRAARSIMSSSALDRRRPPLEYAGAGQRSGDQSFNHAVEVTQSGSVAVLYYDIRNNTPAPGLLRRMVDPLRDDGRTFAGDDHLFGPFDFALAPDAGRGPFVGDGMGLEKTTGDDLVAFYAVSLVESDSDVSRSWRRSSASGTGRGFPPGPCRRCGLERWSRLAPDAAFLSMAGRTSSSGELLVWRRQHPEPGGRKRQSAQAGAYRRTMPLARLLLNAEPDVR